MITGWCFGYPWRSSSSRTSQSILDHYVSRSTDMSRLFIFASLVTHLPQKDDVAKDAQAEEPDLSPERASSNITGYIYGVTPGLAIFIVFGLTKEFRQIMYERFTPRRWRRVQSRSSYPPRSPWSPPMGSVPRSARTSGPYPEPAVVDADLQLDDWNRNKKRRTNQDVFLSEPLLGEGAIPASIQRG